jgi:hypothetical protein
MKWDMNRGESESTVETWPTYPTLLGQRSKELQISKKKIKSGDQLYELSILIILLNLPVTNLSGSVI